MSFHIPKKWLEALQVLAEEHGGMGRLVVKALEELIARYMQPEFIAGRPAASQTGPAPEPQPERRRRMTGAAVQECGRCCKLLAEPERWWQKYLAHLVERARREKGRIFSVVVGRDVSRLFNVEYCPGLASYFTARLHETGCVKEEAAVGRSRNRRGKRLVLDKHCVLSLEAKYL